ncbi:MAG: valine--tRNA ligase [Parcubacteria group bacterium]|jgi:valyl-tRNA synthetase
MTQEIPKTYEANKYEDGIYKLWEESGFFNPDTCQPLAGNKSKKKYCNILPPPNANGELHLGHASGYTVMDIFGRYHRMKGEKVLLFPGKDHAGIQSQVVYERKIKEERGISRYDLGREKFCKEIYDFCIDRSNYMRAQEKKIGISADWSREKFTLDPDVLSRALETFVKMEKDGMIYRGERIINWCPRCATALSDVEVLHKKTAGKLYYIKYPLKDSKQFITVATTRPETMLGDTAVAVNPKDKRFEKLVGKIVILPLQNREIPIISDRRMEMEFGTGAVKITPAHDPLDWQIGKDHKLQEIQVINEKAQITKLGGKYVGQKVEEARENIVRDLTELGLIEKIEENEINKSICERCKETIEPLISKQWFVNVDAKKYSLKKESLKAIKTGKIEVYPKSFGKIMTQWFSGLHDWCISRQIWWGPQIPVWYCEKCGEENYIVSIEKPKNCPKCKGTELTQDPDTFDTWFSSGQWPYTTLGYPKGKDYKDFYSTEMMVTGRDLLFFWASKMIMMGLYRTGKVPFKNLFFTGLIRDKDGLKMSKSKGNGVDPLQMIEKYGADALRMSLITDTTPGLDTRLYEEKIEKYRNFVTKLWNIYRYSFSSSDKFELVEKISKKDIKSLADQWIVSRANEAILEASKMLENKNIAMAENILIKFTWDELADWYLEIHKLEKNDKVLGYVIDKILKLWHPFMPFVTEKIWQDVYETEFKVRPLKFSRSNLGKMLMVEKWPVSDKKIIDKKAEKEFQALQEMIVKIRNIRSSYRIAPSEIIEAYAKKLKNQEIIEKLGRVKFSDMKKQGIEISGKDLKIVLDIAELIDVEKEKKNFEKEISNLENLIAKKSALLVNKNFLASAPKEIVENNKTKLAEYKEKLKSQKDLLDNLKKLS